MERFDVVEYRGGQLVCVLNANVIPALRIAVVAPLMDPEDGPPAHWWLVPQVVVNGVPFLLVLPLLSAVKIVDLGDVHGTLGQERDRITGALDFLFQGF